METVEQVEVQTPETVGLPEGSETQEGMADHPPGPKAEQVAAAMAHVGAYLRYRERQDLQERFKAEYLALVVPFLKLLGFDDVTYLLFSPAALPDWVKLLLGGAVLIGGAVVVRVDATPGVRVYESPLVIPGGQGG